MPDTITEDLPVYQQDGHIPARVPGTEHLADKARATRARSARPASVTLSRTATLAITAPALPARTSPGYHRAAGRADADARSTRRRASSPDNPPARPVRGRP
jgi:hypothetical protein